MHKTLAPLPLFPFAPVAMKRNPPTPTPATATLNPFQLETLESISQETFRLICESVDPENVADLGGHFSMSPVADKVKEAIAEAIKEACEVTDAAMEKDAEIVEAARGIAKAMISPAATDAETFERVWSLAAKMIKEDAADGLGFEKLIGGQIEQLGKDVAGKE